jgi:hypothetical protein
VGRTFLQRCLGGVENDSRDLEIKRPRHKASNRENLGVLVKVGQVLAGFAGVLIFSAL